MYTIGCKTRATLLKIQIKFVPISITLSMISAVVYYLSSLNIGLVLIIYMGAYLILIVGEVALLVLPIVLYSTLPSILIRVILV